MRDDVKRILKMVEEGKISAEDASELIDAFESSDAREADPGAAEAQPNTGAAQPGGKGPTESTAGKDPFKAFVEVMEGFGRDAQKVDWQDISNKVRESAQQGFEALKASYEQVSKGKGVGWFLMGESREVSLPISVPEGKVLRIENLVGSVRVTGGCQNSTAVAKAHFHGSNPEDSKRRAAEYSLLIEESDSMVLIRQADLPHVTVELEVTLTHATPVEVKVESGDVWVTDTHAGARIQSRSSDVRLSGLEGPVDVNVMSGEISLQDVTASQITIENRSGNLTLERISGNISARTTSGDVVAKGLSGQSVSFETVSGDVHAQFAKAITGPVNVRTVSGDSELLLADGSDCRVSLSTLRGEISYDADLMDVVQTDQRLTGRLGAGAGSLDASAVSGDIRLRVAVAQVRD